MNGTPRTDQLDYGMLPDCQPSVIYDCMFRHARQLERELIEAKTENSEMKKAIQAAYDKLDGLDVHMHGNLGLFLLLALEKLQPYIIK